MSVQPITVEAPEEYTQPLRRAFDNLISDIEGGRLHEDSD